MPVRKDDIDVLIINSYAGSLTQGASELGLPIRGSYEDAGFGLAIQMANFPKLDYRETRKDWPAKPDLRRTVVLAHPPCSAFSNQTPKGRTGTESDAFQCTKQVLRYAMGAGAAAVAVESVPGAMAGAAKVHYDYARRYGYHLYKVLQNAVSLGVPQWRPRFWAVFTKADIAPHGMFWKIPTPARYTTVADVLEDVNDPGPVLLDVRRHFERQVQRLREDVGMTHSDVEYFLRNEVGQVHSVLRRRFFPELEPMEVNKRFCKGSFLVKVLRLLDPNGFAPTLLSDSYWAFKGRPLSISDYVALMGFPREYAFPQRELAQFRMYLSKGVCPPVATWVLDTIVKNLTAEPIQAASAVQPGQIANFNLKRKDVNQGKEAA